VGNLESHKIEKVKCAQCEKVEETLPVCG